MVLAEISWALPHVPFFSEETQAAGWVELGDLAAVDQERLYARGLFLSVPRAEEILEA